MDPLGLEDEVDECIRVINREYDNVMFYRAQMVEKGCKMPVLICDCCGQDKYKNVSGYTQHEQSSFLGIGEDKPFAIVICFQHAQGQGGMKDTFRHEFAHAYDTCMGGDTDDCFERACTEIRAWSFGGGCDDPNPAVRQACVASGATESVKWADCPRAADTVAAMMAKCYSSSSKMLRVWPDITGDDKELPPLPPKQTVGGGGPNRPVK
jgi:hypothetical protein